MTSTIKGCKHTNVWIICGGAFLWCYECGAIRPNKAGDKNHKIFWQPPSGNKENPAMKEKYPALTWKRGSL